MQTFSLTQGIKSHGFNHSNVTDYNMKQVYHPKKSHQYASHLMMQHMSYICVNKH